MEKAIFMGRKILIVYAYPEDSGFAETIIEYYTRGLKETDANYLLLNIAQIKFDPILWGGYNSTQEMEPDIIEAQQHIAWADHLVFAYPMWWGGMPALLKGFIERTFLPGFSFRFLSGGKIEKLLTGKTARLIVTMHMSPKEYIDKMCAAGERMFRDAILNFCGIDDIETNYIGPIYKAGEEQKNSWFSDLQHAGKMDAER